MLEMVGEGADKWGVEIVDVQLRGLHPVPRRREDQQQPQGVPVRSECMRAGLALTYQAVCEERLQGRGKRGDRLPPTLRSSRSPASVSSSGAAERYQYVLPGSTWPR